MAIDLESQSVPKRNSVFVELVHRIRQRAPKSVLHDIAHIVLPVSFFLHFLITGTVVLIYTLYFHESIPASYSIGAAIAFGALTALVLAAHLWLYRRRRREQNKDFKLAASANSQKVVENPTSPLTETRRFKTWRASFRNFLAEYERKHYADVIEGWKSPWFSKKALSFEGLKTQIKDYFSRFRHAIATLLGHGSRTAEQARKSTGPRFNISMSNTPTTRSHPNSQNNVPPLSSMPSASHRVELNVVGETERILNQCELENNNGRRRSQYRTPNDVRLSFELHGEHIKVPPSERDSSVTTELSAGIKQRITNPEPQGLTPSPPRHQVGFPPEDSRSDEHNRSAPLFWQPVTATRISELPGRPSTPMPQASSNGNFARQHKEFNLNNPKCDSQYVPFSRDTPQAIPALVDSRKSLPSQHLSRRIPKGMRHKRYPPRHFSQKDATHAGLQLKPPQGTSQQGPSIINHQWNLDQENRMKIFVSFDQLPFDRNSQLSHVSDDISSTIALTSDKSTLLPVLTPSILKNVLRKDSVQALNRGKANDLAPNVTIQPPTSTYLTESLSGAIRGLEGARSRERGSASGSAKSNQGQKYVRNPDGQEDVI